MRILFYTATQNGFHLRKSKGVRLGIEACDQMFRHAHLIAEVTRVSGGEKDADIGADAAQRELGHAAFPQAKVQTRAEKAAITAFPPAARARSPVPPVRKSICRPAQ